MMRYQWRTIVNVILVLLTLIATHAADPAGTKRVEEVEDEISYVQSLMLQTPPLAKLQSEYQDIEVYESSHFGNVLLLDECLQLTERDAPHYNEMLAHVPMMEYLALALDSESDSDSAGNDNDDIELEQEQELLRVLVLGGGDGYVVSELLKYPSIERIDHVELDSGVIDVSKKFFGWTNAWEHEKVNLIIGDGAEFVKEKAQAGEQYHVIIQDASDPFYIDSDGEVVTLPSHVLYEDSHFQMMHQLLKEKNGVLVFQAETYNIPSNMEEIRKWRISLEKIGFQKVRYGSIAIPTYPTGQIGFFASHARDGVSESEMLCRDTDSDFCGNDNSFKNDMDNMSWMNWGVIWKTFKELDGKTKYYHPRIHRR